jgi:CDP-alcohol phosphatidyltransferase
MMPPKRVHIERAAGFVSSFFSLWFVYLHLCLASCLGQKSNGHWYTFLFKGRIHIVITYMSSINLHHQSYVNTNVIRSQRHLSKFETPSLLDLTMANKTRRRRASIELVDAKQAVDLATAQTYSENVFLFVPNLIGKLSSEVTLTPHAHASAPSGYTRVIMAGLSLHYMSYHPIYCTLLYSVSCLLDAVDGQAARALGQTSKFGAVLDMVTDR